MEIKEYYQARTLKKKYEKKSINKNVCEEKIFKIIKNVYQ